MYEKLSQKFAQGQCAAQIVKPEAEAATPFLQQLAQCGIVLNEPQQQAVQIVEGPLMIVAGAGSGKTTTLTSRISYMIHECHIQPSNILLVTFTKKAADEMKARLRTLPNGALCSAIETGTYHALCLKILRTEGYNFGILSSEFKRNLMVKLILKEMDLQEIFTPEEALHLISGWKNQMLKPQDILTFSMDKTYTEGERQVFAQLYEVYKKYEKQKELENLYDFDDFLLETYYLLLNDGEALYRYQQKFQYILCDEFQDVSQIQYEITQMLAGLHNNLCIVGDDGQTIYSWRTASSKYMLEFHEYYPDAKRVVLDINYRSTADVVGFGNNLIAHNEKQIPKTLKSVTDFRQDILLTDPLSPEQEAQQVVAEIKRLHALGHSYRDMAILTRTNTYARALYEEMVFENISFIFHAKHAETFYDTPYVKQFLAVMQLAVDGNYEEAIADVAKLFYISQRDVKKYEQHARVLASASGKDLFTELMTAIARSKKPYQEKKLMEKMRAVQSFQKRKPVDIIREIRKGIIGYEEQLEVDASKTLTVHKDFILEILDEFSESAKRFDTISALLAFVEQLKQKQGEMEQLRQMTGVDAVELMTIHQSKGLEYDIVFGIGWFEGMLPHMNAIDNKRTELPDRSLDAEEALCEERRIAYVCATRAKRYLYLSAPKTYHGKLKEVSRFVQEGAGVTKANNQLQLH